MVEIDININRNPQKYSIYIDNSPIENLKNEILKYCNDEKFLIVISEKVFKLYGKILGFDRKNIFILKDGEREKNFKNYQKITNYALKMELTRKSTIVAIGGGVCGDLAGFVASTYMRGINFIQVPTTLLAATDSSVGGKVAIDTDFGKNLVGSFYQPKVVLINTNFLKTLDDRQFKTGLGEVVKYAFIEKSCKCDEEFNLINFLSEHKEKILNRNLETLSELIRICITLKTSVVQKDETENDLRRILNFGHTYAHAIEKITKYKKYTHGEAVVEGIIFAFNLACKLDMIEKNYKFLADDILNKFDFKKIQKFQIEKMIKIMQTDKKATSKSIVFILPTDYAKVETVEFSAKKLLEIMTNC